MTTTNPKTPERAQLDTMKQSGDKTRDLSTRRQRLVLWMIEQREKKLAEEKEIPSKGDLSEVRKGAVVEDSALT